MHEPAAAPALNARDRRRARLTFVTPVVLGLTLLAALQTYRSGAGDARVAFARRSERVVETLQFRMRAHVDVLRELRAFFVGGRSPGRTTFEEVVQSLELSRRFPGMQAVAFAEQVGKDQLAAFEEKERADGLPGFKVWPPPAAAGELVVVTMIEPRDERNRRVLGFDLLTEPVRRETLERARDRGRSALSNPLRLVQENGVDEQAGFLLCLAVYRKRALLDSVEQRRAAITGYVCDVLRSHDLFARTLGDPTVRGQIGVRVFDGASDAGVELFSSGDPQRSYLRHPRPPLHSLSTVEVGGHVWTVALDELAQPGIDPAYQALVVLLAGSAISLLLLRNVRSAARNERTQQELLEAEQSARLEALRAVRSREDVLKVVSHDLRNPLSAIQLAAQVVGKVLENQGVPAEVRGSGQRAVASVLRSGQRMRLLLADLLDLARIDSGGLNVEPGDWDPAELAREAIELQQPIAQQRAQSLTLEAPDGLPLVRCDRSRVLQIFANLIGNAIKFTPSGGAIVVALQQGTLDLRPAVEFAVRDTGKGISVDQLPHVFERYWQAESTSQQGIGLGLFIVRSLVEAQGGRIVAERNQGPGATFRFLLPAA